MNHTTQEPKSMQLAVELEYRREYEAAHELRTMQAHIADLESRLHAIGAISVKQSIRPQSQLPALQQEPVAWMYEWNGRTHITTADQRPIEHAHPHFNKSNPLYTAPQPTENLNCKSNQKRLATLWGYVKQEPAHHPLTDEQIIEIADKTQTAEPGTDGYILPISFARAIEQAHNITGDQQ